MILAAVAALTMALGLLGGAPTPAHAASEASVTLTQATITGARLTLSGTVTNTGTRPLSQVSAVLWRSASPLRSVAAVTGALTAETTTSGTASVVANTNRALITTGSGTLGVGESRSFSVAGRLSSLGIAEAGASFWVGVDVRGRTGLAGVQTLATDRTLITRPDADVPVTSLASFSAPPRQLKKDLFLDDSLADDLTGRLDDLMRAAEEGRAGWVLDPSLLAEVLDMADGYRVRTPDGSTPGSGSEAARAWLDRLRALPVETGATSLFGNPDLSTLSALGGADVTEASRRATDALAPEDTRPVAVLPWVDAAGARTAGRARTVIAPATDAEAGILVRVAGTTAVLTSPGEPAAVSSAVLRETPLNRRNAQDALTRASGGRVSWLTTTADAEADSALLPQGFRRVSMADVLALTPRTWTPAAHAGEGPLDADRLGRVERLGSSMAVYGEAAPSAGIGEYADAQVARAASGWWIGEAERQEEWLAAIERRLALPPGDFVTITTTPRFSMTGATSEFPVTVTNHLADPVEIRIEADSANPQRIDLIAPEPLTVPPGASSTAILTAEAAGGGVVDGIVRVTTLGGRTLTPDVGVVVETTNVGIIGWIIVIASGVVLVVATALRIRQVRGRRKGNDG